jgi:hypothetical protein
MAGSSAAPFWPASSVPPANDIPGCVGMGNGGRALTSDAKICRPDSTLLCATSAIHDRKRVVFWAQKKFKKVKKKLATPWRLPLEGNFEGQMPSFCRSKKIQKSEKKACQGLRNLISVLKPNQTNGETNDTKRTKNA